MILLQAVGNLAKNPELRGEGENKVCVFSLACNIPYKNEEGKYSTEFLRCVAFGKIAVNIHKYMQKGSQMSIQGYPITKKYQDPKSGQEMKRVEYIITEVEFLSSKKEEK